MAKRGLAKIKQPWQTMGLFSLLLCAAFMPTAAMLLAQKTPHLAPVGISWGWVLLVPMICLPISIGLGAAIVYLSKNQSVILIFTLLCNFFIPAHSIILSLLMLSVAIQVYVVTKVFHDPAARIRELFLLGVSPQRQFVHSVLPRVLKNLHWMYLCSLALCLYCAMNWNLDPSINAGKVVFAMIIPFAFFVMGSWQVSHLRDPYSSSAPATLFLLVLVLGTLANQGYALVDQWPLAEIQWVSRAMLLLFAPLAALGALMADAGTTARKTLLALGVMVVGVGDFSLYGSSLLVVSDVLSVRQVCVALVAAVTMSAFWSGSWKTALAAMILYGAIILSFDPVGKYFAIPLLFLVSWLKPQFSFGGI